MSTPFRAHTVERNRPGYCLGQASWIGLVLVAAVVMTLIVAAGTYVWFERQGGQALVLGATAVEVDITPGAGTRAVAQQSLSQGLRFDPRVFEWRARWLALDKKLQAGSYSVEPGTTLDAYLKRLARGDVNLIEVRIIEGWTLRQIVAQLAKQTDLQQDLGELAGADQGIERVEQALMQRLRIDAPGAEGWFAPDTYLVARRSSALAVLERAYAAQVKRLEQAWTTKAEGLPYQQPYQALIAASIVEKETGSEADRPLVAAVIANRLRIGMPLQVDPSVIYGLGVAFDGNLRKRDLQSDTPYNTYLRRGLPPTPIASPGKASIHAALNPAASKALYFVAKGDGRSHFSENLAEHERAVDRYQRNRGDFKRERASGDKP